MPGVPQNGNKLAPRFLLLAFADADRWSSLRPDLSEGGSYDTAEEAIDQAQGSALAGYHQVIVVNTEAFAEARPAILYAQMNGNGGSTSLMDGLIESLRRNTAVRDDGPSTEIIVLLHEMEPMRAMAELEKRQPSCDDSTIHHAIASLKNIGKVVLGSDFCRAYGTLTRPCAFTVGHADTASQSIAQKQYATRLLEQYAEDAMIASLYDIDETFASAVQTIIGPGFEYPDHSHRTVGNVIRQFGCQIDPALAAPASSGDIEP